MTKSTALIAITGATGNIGSRLAFDLLNKGKKIRVIGRDARKLKTFADRGAETVVASLEDGPATVKALDGATAIFSMIPPNYAATDVRGYQNAVGENLYKGIKKAGINFIVNLSSVGAQIPEENGPIAGLFDQERRLNKLDGANIVHLRPTFFMENLFINIDTIRNMGIMGSPLKGTLPLAMIATRDIAAAASDYLSNLEFKGVTFHELLGPRDLTMNEVAKIFAKAISKKDLTYVQFPYADAEKAMLQMGLSPDTVRLFIEMYKGFNDGIIRPVEKRSAHNTTPTTIEDFAQVFAEIFSSAAKVTSAV